MYDASDGISSILLGKVFSPRPTADSRLTTTGIICALAAEAKCLPAGTDDIRVHISGPGAVAARKSAEALVAGGVQGLISYGVAVGLVPQLPTGSLLLPATIYTNKGSLPVDARWHTRVKTLLISHGYSLSSGAMADTPVVLATPLAKQALAATCNAVGADMESAAIGAVARDAGLPFLVIRAVVDPLEQTLPPWVASALDEDGGLRLSSVCKGLLRQPTDLGALLALAREFRCARQSLREVADVLGQEGGFRIANT